MNAVVTVRSRSHCQSYCLVLPPPERSCMKSSGSVFIVFDLIVLGLPIAFPEIATWLPQRMIEG